MASLFAWLFGYAQASAPVPQKSPQLRPAPALSANDFVRAPIDLKLTPELLRAQRELLMPVPRKETPTPPFTLDELNAMMPAERALHEELAKRRACLVESAWI